MTGGSHIHPDKYLGIAWADRPPTLSGPSARQVLQLVPHLSVSCNILSYVDDVRINPFFI